MTEEALAALTKQNEYYETVASTLPAAPGHYLLEEMASYEDEPWSYCRYNIIAWNITRGGWLKPLTLNYESYEVLSRRACWVLFPDGRVEGATSLELFDSVEKWADAMRKLDAKAA